MNSFNSNNDNEFDDELVSKSELKRQMHALQTLGESLMALPQKQLHALEISDELQEAISIAKDMKNDNGRRRQLQRIGKLMRFEDAEAIKEQLAASLQTEKKQQSTIQQQQQKITSIVESLINENHALTQLIEQYPNANIQLLRQLIKNIRKEKPKEDSTGGESKNAKRLLDEIAAIVKA